MAEIDLTLIGKTVLEAREEPRQFRTEVLADLRSLRDDQTVMIRMLQAREAELDLMRSLEQAALCRPARPCGRGRTAAGQARSHGLLNSGAERR